MRLPLSWLHQYIDPGLDPRTLASQLAMSGTEVDRIDHHGVDALENFVVGKVLTAEQHPDADRLKVCTVDVGDAEPKQIVCGAPNVAAGQTVAVARPGSVMPDGTKLKPAKLRGVVSDGMILAEDEVALGDDHAGTMVLDDALAAGTPLIDVLPISTDVLELEITPNRPDCLGVYGVAREVHAVTGADLAPEPWAVDPGPQGDAIDGVRIDVEVGELCPRFTARAFENVTIAPSPAWLRGLLLAAGQRPINNVVDITNYTMLLTGQPLHAFDLDRVAGGHLVIRLAADGEKMTTLDGVERTLDSEMVLIADDDGPTSIAGIMGGQRSEVEPGTTRVLMEVATWDGPNINRTMARLALRSEAGARNEKGLSPLQPMEAQAIASKLMVELAGATEVGGTIDVRQLSVDVVPEPIRLRDERVQSLLGAPVERWRSAQILTALGFTATETDDGLDVAVPHFRRRDVTREADLIEEVARINGFESLPSTVQENRTGGAGRLSQAQRLRRRAEDALVGAGLYEVVGWSFTEPAVLDRLRLPADHGMRDYLTLENPMSEAQSIMRPSILPSLLDIAAHNVSHGTSAVGIFESGAVYRRGDELADEHHALAALVTGAAVPPSWATPDVPIADYFTAKGLLEAVAGALRVPLEFTACAEWPFLHPSRSAEVVAEGARIGFIGEVHPLVTAEWDLDANPVAVFAVDLGKLVAAAPSVITYADVTTFPAVRQDFAVVVDEAVPSAAVAGLVGRYAASVEVFDVYRGEQLGQGRKSIALRCEFSAQDRTLTDEDVAPIRAKIVKKLAEDFGGELRG